MKQHASFSLFVLVVLAVLGSAFPALAGDEEAIELFDYTVKKGDSCASVAIEHFGSRKGWSIIHKYNELGPAPHKLEAGQILKLPRPSSRPDATIEDRRGSVEYRKASEPAWGAANIGLELYRAWRVWSHADSTAVVEFQDKSALSMREDTVVIVYGTSQASATKRVGRAELTRGQLRTRLEGLEGNLEVSTPSSVVALETSSSVIGADVSGRTSVSMHTGSPARVRAAKSPQGARAVELRPGKGTWVEKGQAPVAPVDLPPAPVLRGVRSAHVGWKGQGVTISGNWEPVPGAAKYRIEIALDPKLRLVAAAVVAPANVRQFQAQNLPPGNYYVSVAAIDDKGLESVPSKRSATSAFALDIRGIDGLETTHGSVAETFVGSMLEAPESCQIQGSESSMFVRLGRALITCDGALPLLVQVRAPDVQLEGAQGAMRMAAGAESTALLRLDPLPAQDAVFMVETTAGFEATARSAAGGIELQVHAPEGKARGRAIVSRRVGDVSVEVTRVNVESTMAHAARPAESSVKALVGLTAGALVGGEVDTDEVVLATAGVASSFLVSPSFDARLSLDVGRRAEEGGRVEFATGLEAGFRRAVGPVVLRAGLGPALWLDIDAEEGTTVALQGSLGAALPLGPGALVLEGRGFAFGKVSGRGGFSLGYRWALAD